MNSEELKEISDNFSHSEEVILRKCHAKNIGNKISSKHVSKKRKTENNKRKSIFQRFASLIINPMTHSKKTQSKHLKG